jgi:hypothetical protein
MRERLGVIATVLVFASSLAWAQGAAPPSLQDQLSAQYKLVKTGRDGSGKAIIEPGTVLKIQKGGILGVGSSSAVICPAKFENGDLKHPNGFCANMVKSSSRYFAPGEEVYVVKLDVNTGKGQITLRLLDCDSCNGSQQPAYYKSEVVFQFPKGYLETASVPKVEDTIAQVFTIDDSGGQQLPQGDPGAQSQQSGDPQPQQQPAQPAQQQAPQSVEKGQTIEQVVALWGQPQKIVNLDTKTIYYYPDAKITFLNGKVSDVQ